MCMDKLLNCEFSINLSFTYLNFVADIKFSVSCIYKFDGFFLL